MQSENARVVIEIRDQHILNLLTVSLNGYYVIVSIDGLIQVSTVVLLLRVGLEKRKREGQSSEGLPSFAPQNRLVARLFHINKAPQN